jgi:putative sterol carrier protein
MENGFGPAPRPADADLLMTHATAKALYSGATKMQVAFMQGKVKAKGNMAKMLKSQSTLNGIMPIIDRVTSEY